MEKNLDVTFSNKDWTVSVGIPCSYTINKAPLTIIPNSIKQNYGEEIPEFSCTYIGFKNKETSEVLIKKPNVYNLKTEQEVKEAANKLPFNEEGYVVVDSSYHRVKIKSPKYIHAHAIKNNGVITTKRILSMIIN